MTQQSEIEEPYFREEPRFYPVQYAMPIDDWLKLPKPERQRVVSEFIHETELHNRQRIRDNHPSWNETQVELFYFKLKFMGDCFYMAVEGMRRRAKLMEQEIQEVADTPLPATPEESAKYL